jgi:hypothetical protein
MKNQGTSKSHTTKYLHDSEVDEISNIELKRMIRMISDAKGDMYKYLNEIKENTNKHLNELKEDKKNSGK